MFFITIYITPSLFEIFNFIIIQVLWEIQDVVMFFCRSSFLRSDYFTL